MINIIVAYDEHRAIGYDGKSLWGRDNLHCNLRHFYQITLGSAVIMGRKTYESIGKSLPGRKNIVVTSSRRANMYNVEIAHSLEDAYIKANCYKQVFIIGGGEIYRQSLSRADRIYATEVKTVAPKADTYFPELDGSWQVIDRQYSSVDDRNSFSCGFVVYERKKLSLALAQDLP